MTTVALAFGCGFVLGVVFALIKLPVPAPGTFAGAAGVVGVTCAYLVVTAIRRRYFP